MAITSIVSINQLITWFQDFQENHYFLKDFGFGEPYDIGTSRQMKFPYMWVTMNEDNNIATGSNVKSAIPDISFSIMFMDKINNQPNYLDQNGFQSDNSQNILSDTLQCLQDLITEIQQNWGQYGVMISQDVSFYPAVDETQDKATGVVGRFVLRTRQVNCVLPESPNTIVVQPNQPTYATLLTCESLDECNTFQEYAYTGGTFTGSTLTLNSMNGNELPITGFSRTLNSDWYVVDDYSYVFPPGGAVRTINYGIDASNGNQFLFNITGDASTFSATSAVLQIQITGSTGFNDFDEVYIGVNLTLTPSGTSRTLSTTVRSVPSPSTPITFLVGNVNNNNFASFNGQGSMFTKVTMLNDRIYSLPGTAGQAMTPGLIN